MPHIGKKPVDVRADLVRALARDMVGPVSGGDLTDEVLSQAPSRRYLTGFLVPLEAGEDQRTEATSEEVVDELGDATGTDDATPPEPPSAKRAFFPSSMGMSLLADPGKRNSRRPPSGAGDRKRRRGLRLRGR